MDVQYQPCSGWNSPVFDVAMEASGASSSRVVLALSDGDAIVFATTSGKNRACDLVMKFPRVSTIPYKLLATRGYMMALPTPLSQTPDKADYLRDLIFFSMSAMEAGYGSQPSQAIMLQASFRPRRPDAVVQMPVTQEKGRSYLAIRFEGETGVELFELNMKPPAPPKASGAGDDGWMSYLNYMPTALIFGLGVLAMVVMNVRKVTNQKSAERVDAANDFDTDFIRERLREHRDRRGGLGGDDFGRGGGRSEPRVEDLLQDLNDDGDD